MANRSRPGSFLALSLLSAPLVFSGACSFPRPEEGSQPDAMQAPLPLTCDGRYSDLCVNLDLASTRDFLRSTELDTDSSADCARFPFVAPASRYCVIIGSTITVAAGVTIRAIGSRPLVFFSPGAITIDGTIDVSSQRATRAIPPVAEIVGAGGNSAMCSMFRRAVDSSVDGGGGGAGGAGGGTGGGGGDGNYDVLAARAQGGLAPMEPDAFPDGVLRGGCRGQNGGNAGPAATNGGTGGAGGGVVAVISSMDIVVNGVIAANGAGGTGGGRQAGGGGGGSGGLIILRGTAVRRAGQITANGGGGGEGGIISPIDATDVIGADGADGAVAITRAPGGNDALPPSRGGEGGARGSAGGDIGSPSDESGGGGGGGGGFIQITGNTSAAGGSFESPAPIIVTN